MAVPLTLSSVPAQTPYVQYVSGASQTVFPYPFEITQDSDLVVLLNGVAQPTDGGYTLTGQGTTVGGNVTFTVGLTAGIVVTLYRNISIARITQLSQNGTFFSANFNNEFNRIYLIMQQLQQSLLPGGVSAFALMVPNSNNPTPTTLLTPAAYANKYLSFDSNGNPQPAALTSLGTITSAILAPFVNLQQTAAEAAASVVPTNIQYPPGVVDRYQTNTTPGTTDMHAAFVTALSCNSVVIAPYGPYLVGSTIVLSGNVTVMGAFGGDISAQPTSLVHSTGSTGPLFQATGTEFGSLYVGRFDISGGNGSCCVLSSRPQATFELLHMEGVNGYNGSGIVLLGGLVLTGTVSIGNTSATLQDIWVGPTGAYPLVFSNGDARSVTLTNGATTITWTGGLSGTSTAAPTFNQGSWEVKIKDCKHVAPHTGGSPTANNYRSYIINVNGGATILDRCLATYSSVGCDIQQGQNIVINRPDFNSCGPNATDSASNGQCGIRIAGHGYKQSIDIYDPWLEGCVTSAWIDQCTGVGIHKGFIDDLGATNTPAIYIASSAAIATVVDGAFIQVRNGASTLACVSNNGTGSTVQNTTFNANNAAATQKTIINSVVMTTFNNQNAATNNGTISDPSFLITDSTPVNSQFTATMTGATTAPTGAVGYAVNGRQVTLNIPEINATSNATSFTLTGLPAALQPVAGTYVCQATGQDSGSFTALTVTVTHGSGTLTLSKGGSTSGWTGTGTKGVHPSTITYLLS